MSNYLPKYIFWFILYNYVFWGTKYSYTKLQNDGSKHGNTANSFMDQGDIQMVNREKVTRGCLLKFTCLHVQFPIKLMTPLKQQ